MCVNMSTQITIDKDLCRICLTSKKPLCHLFKYKLSGNYAEMLTSIADVKVASNDGLPDKICTKCCSALEKAFCLKTVAERSDRKLRKIIADRSTKIATKKIAFDSFKDIKSEIPLQVKSEPKWELEIEMSNNNSAALKPIETIDGKDIVIANTVIKKVDKDAKIKSKVNDTVDLTGSDDYNKNDDIDAEYLDDDVFQDDDRDEDYVPPVEKIHKFKKPKLTEVKVYNEKKTIVRKIKVLKKIKDDSKEGTNKVNKYRVDGLSKATMITCYPIMKNGSRGPPILLKRPKDATVLKIHPNYKSNGSYEGTKVIHREKPLRIVRNPKASQKQKEKLVCPVCGILTFTLGNHMATHDEKKRYNCTDCSKTFSQKGNLLAHLKQHSGIKDHICEICGAGFYNQKSLVRHNLIHKGERPFPCNLCNKKFIARCDLNRHLRIHSGYKPYKCDVCAMSFNAKHQLQNHERMHTGERPYTCQVCNVAFSYKVNLNNHVFKVHGINLKFKSIHTITEEVLRKELGIANEAQEAISHIVPHNSESGWGRQSPPPDTRDTKSPINDYRIS